MARIDAGGRKVRLTYCTNVHPGETLAEVRAQLDRHAVPLRARAFPDREMGIGLWLAAPATAELARDRGRIAEFAEFLRARGLFVFTLNAFPIGGFHAARVKERVFVPSWADPARLAYTLDCATVLAALLDDGGAGSISTVPLGMTAAGFGAADRVLAIENLSRAAERIARIAGETGRSIVLALEPEPGAVLDTIASAVDFVAGELHPSLDAPARRAIGVCLDACHEAVMDQDPAAALAKIAARGVPLGKVQVTAALAVERPGENARGIARLAAFAEERYLHQVAWRDGRAQLHVARDLSDFLAERPNWRDAAAVRAHFHVPVFAVPGGGLATTRDALAAFLPLAVASGLTDQFEVETYTFDVIPSAERAALGAATLADALAHELEWTRSALSGQPPAATVSGTPAASA